MLVFRAVWAKTAAFFIFGSIQAGGGTAQDDVHQLRGTVVYPQIAGEEHRSEEQPSPPNYTGWSPELVQRDTGGGRREFAAPDGAVLQNTLSTLAEIERDILVRRCVGVFGVGGICICCVKPCLIREQPPCSWDFRVSKLRLRYCVCVVLCAKLSSWLSSDFVTGTVEDFP